MDQNLKRELYRGTVMTIVAAIFAGTLAWFLQQTRFGTQPMEHNPFLPIVNHFDLPSKCVVSLDAGMITNVQYVYGIPVINSKPKKIIFPEEFEVTNYVRSTVCIKCGGNADWTPSDDFGNTGKRPPKCPMLAVYPGLICEYPIVGTNIERRVRWIIENDKSTCVPTTLTF